MLEGSSPQARLVEPYEGWVSVITPQRAPALVQVGAKRRVGSVGPGDAPRRWGGGSCCTLARIWLLLFLGGIFLKDSQTSKELPG